MTSNLFSSQQTKIVSPGVRIPLASRAWGESTHRVDEK